MAMARIDVNVKGLKRLLVDFHVVTGQRIGVFDAELNPVLDYPEPHTPFCAAVRRSPNGAARCRRCDSNGMRQAIKEGKTVEYRCHAGLLEVCAPVIDKGRILGFLMFGQVMYDRNAEEQWEAVREGCKNYFRNTGELYAAFRGVRRIDPAYLNSTAHLLTAIVEYVRMEHMIRQQPGGFWTGVVQYIEAHAPESVTLTSMASDLGVSVSTLCQAAQANAGKTIGRLIMEHRMSIARTLLTETPLPVSEVAAQSGYPDYNYFSRIFRRENGITPSEYRRRSFE